ncbi:MAG: hypothetical protein Q7S13_05495, partial [Candidatus Omnitrophota bacterium]|nr:hypothetical protein [Candidatus Omnitrophota bacterium]
KASQDHFAGNDFSSHPGGSLSTLLLQIQSVFKESEEALKLVSEKMRQEIKQNPWASLGKVAMGSFGFGLITARRLTSRTKVKR